MERKQAYDCKNAADQNAIALHHRLPDQTVFDRYLTNFWGHTNIPSVRKSWEYMSVAMLFQNCKTRKWAFEADDNDTINNDIDFGFEDIPPGVIVNYSIALFKGIHNLDSPTDFHFYKAKDDEERFTVIFKVFCEDGNIRFYDLSNDFP